MENLSIAEFLTLLTMLATGLGFIYSEVKNFRSDVKTDFAEVRANRKAELEQVKLEMMSNIADTKLQVHNLLVQNRAEAKLELSQARSDTKTDINELKRDARDDMSQMRGEILRLSEHIARLNSTLDFLRDDKPPKKSGDPIHTQGQD